MFSGVPLFGLRLMSAASRCSVQSLLYIYTARFYNRCVCMSGAGRQLTFKESYLRMTQNCAAPEHGAVAATLDDNSFERELADAIDEDANEINTFSDEMESLRLMAEEVKSTIATIAATVTADVTASESNATSPTAAAAEATACDADDDKDRSHPTSQTLSLIHI